MVILNDISVKYEAEVSLEHVSLSVDEKSPSAIIGPSGCGKSTLIYVLSKLLTPDSGAVSYKGDMDEKTFYQTMSLCLQRNGLFPWKTVYENITLSLCAKGQKKDAKAIAQQALSAVGILDQKDKYPSQLSGGQLQRAVIAGALASRSSLVTLDEPCSALDDIAKETIQQLILILYTSYHMGYILVTHDISEAVYLGKQIIIMKKAGIKTIIDNPFFMRDKDTPECAHFCKTIRGYLV